MSIITNDQDLNNALAAINLLIKKTETKLRNSCIEFNVNIFNLEVYIQYGKKLEMLYQTQSLLYKFGHKNSNLKN